MAIVLPKFSRRRAPAGFASEAQPAVNLCLCRDDSTYIVGSTLTARWRISRVPLEEIQSLEVSVLWHTEGKGDEDLYVHHFYRVVENQIRRSGLADEQSTQCVLPLTPLSYQGRLISVRWCVRLRLFLSDGREIVSESPFHLVSHTLDLTQSNAGGTPGDGTPGESKSADTPGIAETRGIGTPTS